MVGGGVVKRAKADVETTSQGYSHGSLRRVAFDLHYPGARVMYEAKRCRRIGFKSRFRDQ